MPLLDSVSPRKMLPPPTTTASSTPSFAVSATSVAMVRMVSGEMP
jgi:hypothetical protein